MTVKLSERTQKILQMAKNVDTISLPEQIENAALVICNNYTGTRYDLGTGPVNDGLEITKVLYELGYEVYYLYNSKRDRFIEVLNHFLRSTIKHLVVYYVGHGISVKDENGDEDDGYDEAMVFVDGNVIDDELASCLAQNKNPLNKLTLFTDACHSGSMWDIQSRRVDGVELPDNIVSISASTDGQKAKQTVVNQIEQGIFTYSLRRAIEANKKVTPREVQQRVSQFLTRFNQCCVIAATNEEDLDKPIFD